MIRVVKMEHERAMILSDDGKGIADGAEPGIRRQSVLRRRYHRVLARSAVAQDLVESRGEGMKRVNARKGMLGRTNKDQLPCRMPTIHSDTSPPLN